MTSTTETGHAKNVANFNTLIAHVKSLGAAYNPANSALQLTTLEALALQGHQSIENVNRLQPDYPKAITLRETSFAPLSKLITRVFNALKVSGAPEHVVANAKTIATKIKGSSAAKKPEVQSLTGEPQPRRISTSQMSFDSRLDNLDKLIKILQSTPEYQPNENDLKVSTLVVLYNKLMAENALAVSAAIPLNAARVTRNEILYNKTKGLAVTAANVKTYIKSVFGATSPQYKQISTLKIALK